MPLKIYVSEVQLNRAPSLRTDRESGDRGDLSAVSAKEAKSPPQSTGIRGASGQRAIVLWRFV